MNEQFNLYGSAKQHGNSIQLTPEEKCKVGLAWFKQPISLTEPFSIEVTFQMTYKGSYGADGIALVFQNEGNTYDKTIDVGYKKGYHSLKHFVAVEVDTWNSRPGAIKLNSQNSWSPFKTLLQHYLNKDVNKGEIHTLKFDYVLGTFFVTFDGITIMTHKSNLCLEFNSPNVFVGITGATGDCVQSQIINSFTYIRNPPSTSFPTISDKKTVKAKEEPRKGFGLTKQTTNFNSQIPDNQLNFGFGFASPAKYDTLTTNTPKKSDYYKLYGRKRVMDQDTIDNITSTPSGFPYVKQEDNLLNENEVNLVQTRNVKFTKIHCSRLGEPDELTFLQNFTKSQINYESKEVIKTMIRDFTYTVLRQCKMLFDSIYIVSEILNAKTLFYALKLVCPKPLFESISSKWEEFKSKTHKKTSIPGEYLKHFSKNSDHEVQFRVSKKVGALYSLVLEHILHIFYTVVGVVNQTVSKILPYSNTIQKVSIHLALKRSKYFSEYTKYKVIPHAFDEQDIGFDLENLHIK